MRCWVKSRNERNPHGRLYVSGQTAATNAEEGGDDVKSARLLHPGRHTRYNGRDNGHAKPQGGANPIKGVLSSDWSLQPDSMKAELLVTAGQPYGGEYVPGPCTHRPSRHESRQHLKPVGQPAREAAVEGGAGDWDEVVTR